MPDYQQGKIYKIICNVTGKVYYGSTIVPTLARRLAKHKEKYRAYMLGKCNYVTSFEILDKNDYSIILVELYPCNSRDELLMRERYWFDNFECINKIRPILTEEERRQNNRKNYHQKLKSIKN